MRDFVMQIVWTALAAAAVALAAKLRAPRGLWPAFAALCVVIAIDKAVDLQTHAYVAATAMARALLDALGLADARGTVKAALLVVVAAGIVAVILRSAPRATRGERFALAAFALVAALVGAHFVPGLGWLNASRLDWAGEALACGLLVAGLVDGFRRCGRADVNAARQ